MTTITIDTFRLREHHAVHYERPIVEVHLWDSVYARRGWRVQFYDAIWATPPVGHPHAYEPDAASMNRLLRALKGWDCRWDDGIFVWTRPHPDNCEGCDYCSKETNE